MAYMVKHQKQLSSIQILKKLISMKTIAPYLTKKLLLLSVRPMGQLSLHAQV